MPTMSFKWYKRQAIECQSWALNGLKDKLSGANHGL